MNTAHTPEQAEALAMMQARGLGTALTTAARWLRLPMLTQARLVRWLLHRRAARINRRLARRGSALRLRAR